MSRSPGSSLSAGLERTGLFKDLHGHTKFEVSGLTEHNGAFVMVFDSLMELGFTDPRLGFMGANNYLAGKREGESEYEAVVTRTKTSALSSRALIIFPPSPLKTQGPTLCSRKAHLGRDRCRGQGAACCVPLRVKLSRCTCPHARKTRKEGGHM